MYRTTPEPQAGGFKYLSLKKQPGTHRRLWHQRLSSQWAVGLVPWKAEGKAKLLPIGETVKDIPFNLTLHWPVRPWLCHLFSKRKEPLTSSWKLHGAAALPSPGSVFTLSTLLFLVYKPSISPPAWDFSSWFVGTVNYGWTYLTPSKFQPKANPGFLIWLPRVPAASHWCLALLGQLLGGGVGAEGRQNNVVHH